MGPAGLAVVVGRDPQGARRNTEEGSDKPASATYGKGSKMTRGKIAVLTIGSAILLTAGLLSTIPKSSTHAGLSLPAAITPTAWAYLPWVNNRPFALLYSSLNLDGHTVFAECNPGGTSSCPCSESDVSISWHPDYGEVTSNPRLMNTYVNAIGAKKFVGAFPDGTPITLGTYSYRGEISLPLTPTASVSQTVNSQAAHMMIQLWDGSNSLYPSNKNALEGTIYWSLNAWVTDTYGHVLVYTGGDPLVLFDTGLVATPDTNWHPVELTVDLKKQEYVSITVDGQTRDLSDIDLARVSHPNWGDELALTITTESLAAWPGPTCPFVFTWTTRFRNLEFRNLPFATADQPTPPDRTAGR